MQIYFNGQELDLKPDERVAITLQMNDLADISKPNTSYTNRFKINKTNKNLDAFKFLGVAGSTSRIPYQLNSVDVIQDTLPLVINGFCEISENAADNYSINIYGSEKTIFEKFKNVTLKDIYPVTNVLWTAANLLNYVDSNENFCFPVAQYNSESIHSGFLSTQAFTRTRTTVTSPHFFVKYIFEQIFNFLGYDLEYPMVNDSEFGKLLIPSQKGVSHFNVQDAEVFNIQQCVHDVACDVLIREIMQRFGLVIKCDELQKSVKFMRMEDLLTTSEINNWTDKFDSLVNEKYLIGSYGQKNIYKYNEDVADENFPEWFPANVLEGSFNITNEILPLELTIFESSFVKAKYWGSISPINSYNAQGRIYYSNYPVGRFLLDVAENKADEDDNTVEPKEVPFQLMYLQTYPEIVNFTFLEPLGGQYSNNFPLRICTYDNLSFQYYIDNNYTRIIDLFNNMSVVKVKMKLSVIDIYQFDFFKRVYLEQFSSYFFINKITNWEKDKLVEVELIKIPPINNNI